MAIDLNDPNLASTIYKFTPDGVGSTFGSVPGQGHSITFDSAGNLFANDSIDQAIYELPLTERAASLSAHLHSILTTALQASPLTALAICSFHQET
jgi:hypothetical protein